MNVKKEIRLMDIALYRKRIRIVCNQIKVLEKRKERYILKINLLKNRNI